ncbi:hypothetical protein ABNF97_28785 [Plantactinospora sp. B6F1]
MRRPLSSPGLAVVTNQIVGTEAAIARYHTAFENGAMDDAAAASHLGISI